MKKYAISVRVPTPDEAASGLDVTDQTAFVTARAARETARQALEHGRRQAREMHESLERIRQAVAAGHSPVTVLQDALRERDALAMVVPNLERRLADAEARASQAEQAARAAVVAEAGRRGRELQAIADQVAPLLEHVKHCEAALDRAVQQAGAPCVPPVLWPDSLDTDGLVNRLALERVH